MSDRQVLFVEDEASLLDMIGDALACEGYRVTPARNGNEGIALLGGDARFDCIVSDVIMPEGVSGIELAQRAAELQPQARVVLVSGLSKAQLPPLPASAAFLPKPYRLRQLLEALEAPVDASC